MITRVDARLRGRLDVATRKIIHSTVKNLAHKDHEDHKQLHDVCSLHTYLSIPCIMILRIAQNFRLSIELRNRIQKITTQIETSPTCSEQFD